MWDIAKVLEYYGAEPVPDGTNRPVRCPFHDDRQASASVDTYKGVFNCHGCDAAGDAIAIIREQEGVDYETAVRRAQEITGDSGANLRGSTGRERGSLLPGWTRNYSGDSGTLPPWLRG